MSTVSPSPSSGPGARFTVVRLRAGYHVAEVDAFVDRCRAALTRRDGSVTAGDVAAVQFTPVRLRGGYDMGEVDRYLGQVSGELAEQAAASSMTTGTTGDAAIGAAASTHCPGCRCAELGLLD